MEMFGKDAKLEEHLEGLNDLGTLVQTLQKKLIYTFIIIIYQRPILAEIRFCEAKC